MKALLEEVRDYIEDTQETIDCEWGGCRSVEEMIKDRAMPEIYNKVLSELSKLNQ